MCSFYLEYFIRFIKMELKVGNFFNFWNKFLEYNFFVLIVEIFDMSCCGGKFLFVLNDLIFMIILVYISFNYIWKID